MMIKIVIFVIMMMMMLILRMSILAYQVICIDAKNDGDDEFNNRRENVSKVK